MDKPDASEYPPRRPPVSTAFVAFFALFALAALAPAVVLRGFTVDDALITARYAANVASGAGYRLSAGGPVTDGVTPLGFVYVLAPFAGGAGGGARGGVIGAFVAAKWLGVVAWTVAAGVLGLVVARRCAASRGAGGSSGSGGSGGSGGAGGRWLVPLALVATSAPLGAWAPAGMETGVVLALGALAASLPLLERPRAGIACAGIAAGLRPELLPWAATLGVGLFLSPPSAREGASGAGVEGAGAEGAALPSTAARRRSLLLLVFTFTPFVVVAAVRLAAFGRPAPLSIFAKAPDARLGLMYAAACALLAGGPALLAPRAAWKLRDFERALVVGVPVHLVAIALAGGDWMPLSRLVVPVLPSLALAALLLAERAHLLATAARLALAVAGQTFVLVHVGPKAAAVGEDRMRVLDDLRPALAPAHVVASLDIGWVGAATDATLVDLAGVTDPAIAALPGGHTTKQIPAGLLDARRADTLVLLLAPGEQVATPWTRSRFARGVEAWVATTPGIGDTFTPVAESSLPHLRYVVLQRTEPTR